MESVVDEGMRPRRRVLLVEDQTSMRTLLAAALENAGFDVSAHASASEAIKAFASFDPDALIADIDLGDRPNGVELATILRAQAPYLGLVFLTNFSSVKALERTVQPPEPFAFLQKELLNSTDQLISVIESSLDDSARPTVVTVDVGGNPLHALTATQLDVLRLIAMGYTNSEIATTRNSSLRAVERLVCRIFEVLEINDEPNRNPRVLAANLYTRTFGYPLTHSATS